MSSNHKVLIKHEIVEVDPGIPLISDSIFIPSASDPSHHHPNIKAETCSVSEPGTDNNEDTESQFQLTSIITVEPVTVKREILPDYEDEEHELSKSSVQNVQRKYHYDTPSICTICNTGFPNGDLYEQHLIKAHKDIRPFPCKICRKRFKTEKDRRSHEEIHNPNRYKGEPQFACDKCDKSYHLKHSLVCHQYTAHKGYKPPPRRKKTEPRLIHRSRKGTKNPEIRHPEKETFVCQHCQKSFRIKSQLDQHVNLHLKKKAYQCKTCSSTFYHPKYLKRHVKQNHEKGYTKTDCTCKICGKVLINPDKLKYHLTLHNGGKPFECEHCGNKFKTKGSWSQHEKNYHTNEDENSSKMLEFKCRICGRSGMNQWQYQGHRKTTHKHIPNQGDDEKCFACGVCDQPFSQRIYAVICALAGHDAEQVKAKMFKFQCPECPPEALKFHNTIALQKHWEIQHPLKVIPPRFSNQMFNKHINYRVLPVYKKNKKLCEEIKKCNGPPDSSVKYDFPLWKDLDLLPFSEEQRLYEEKAKTRKRRVVPLVKELDANKISFKTVNVNDASAVRDLLGDRMLKLVLQRC